MENLNVMKAKFLSHCWVTLFGLLQISTAVFLCYWALRCSPLCYICQWASFRTLLFTVCTNLGFKSLLDRPKSKTQLLPWIFLFHNQFSVDTKNRLVQCIKDWVFPCIYLGKDACSSRMSRAKSSLPRLNSVGKDIKDIIPSDCSRSSLLVSSSNPFHSFKAFSYMRS